MENKNFYSITKGQLKTIWVFGLIGAIFSFSQVEYEDAFFGIIGIGMLFFIFFYTIGWKANKKSKTQ